MMRPLGASRETVKVAGEVPSSPSGTTTSSIVTPGEESSSVIVAVPLGSAIPRPWAPESSSVKVSSSSSKASGLSWTETVACSCPGSKVTWVCRAAKSSGALALAGAVATWTEHGFLRCLVQREREGGHGIGLVRHRVGDHHLRRRQRVVVGDRGGPLRSMSVAWVGADSTTVKDSSPSNTTSPLTGTWIVRSVWPGAKLSSPWLPA